MNKKVKIKAVRLPSTHMVEYDEVKNKKDFYVCLFLLNRSKDRFKRILKPTKITHLEYPKRASYNGKEIKLIPYKGKKFSYDTSIYYFNNFEDCVLHFNQQIDEQTLFLKEQVELLKKKYETMIDMKINLREMKFKRVLKKK